VATIGDPDMNAVHSAVAAARSTADLQQLVPIGSSDLMEFVRFDAGAVLRKERGGARTQDRPSPVGNALIIKEMAKTVPERSIQMRSVSALVHGSIDFMMPDYARGSLTHSR
jgi:hypothetical protein